jgi:hypothetical protein
LSPLRKRSGKMIVVDRVAAPVGHDVGGVRIRSGRSAARRIGRPSPRCLAARAARARSTRRGRCCPSRASTAPRRGCSGRRSRGRRCAPGTSSRTRPCRRSGGARGTRARRLPARVHRQARELAVLEQVLVALQPPRLHHQRADSTPARRAARTHLGARGTAPKGAVASARESWRSDSATGSSTPPRADRPKLFGPIVSCRLPPGKAKRRCARRGSRSAGCAGASARLATQVARLALLRAAVSLSPPQVVAGVQPRRRA